MPPDTSGLSGLWELFLERGFTVFRKDIDFKEIMFEKNLSIFIFFFEIIYKIHIA